MIRFIDLTGQIYLDDEEKCFAFFDTVRDKFCEFSGCQQWDSIEEFKNDYTGAEINRYLALIPKEFKTNYSWKNVKVMLLGEEIEVQPIQYIKTGTITINDLLREKTKNSTLDDLFYSGAEITINSTEIEELKKSGYGIENGFFSWHFGGINIKQDSRITIDDKEYLCCLVTRDKIILKVAGVIYA